jgi:hypothetical protein
MIYQEGIIHFYQINIVFPISIARSDYLVVGAILLKALSPPKFPFRRIGVLLV